MRAAPDGNYADLADSPFQAVPPDAMDVDVAEGRTVTIEFKVRRGTAGPSGKTPAEKPAGGKKLAGAPVIGMAPVYASPVAAPATGTGKQVMVKLQLFEVSLTKLRSLGFVPAKLFGSPGLIASSSPGHAGDSAKPFLIVNINDDGKAQKSLEALRKDKLARVLAEPTLLAISRRPTSWKVGGELRVPRARQKDPLVIEYGTRVDLTPKVSGDNVHLALRFGYSTLDYSHMESVGDQTVPGVHVGLDIETGLDLKNGQTVVLRGPTQVVVEAFSQGPPYLSQLPYVGAMFSSVKHQRNEIATFLFVRADILKTPLTAAQPAAATPQGNAPAVRRPGP
jgi:Flp pilus assembly secretin CpaC